MVWWKSRTTLAVGGIVGAGALAIALTRGGAASPGAAPDAGAAVTIGPPDRLLCDVYVETPNATWGKLQRGIGGAVGILPATLPGLIVTLADLDVQLANELDGSAPLVGVVAGDPADPGVAIAIRLVDPRRARMALAEGETARFTAKPAGDLTLLVAKPNQARNRAFELALTSNGYLLAGRREADLVALGPYASRNLAARPPPETGAAVIDVPRSAIEAVLAPRLDAIWKETRAFLLAEDSRMRAERGGRAPDFGDPVAIVGAVDGWVRRQLALASDLARVRVVLDATDDALLLAATLVPQGDKGAARAWIDGMKVGDAADVLALPSTSTLAIATRDDLPTRTEQAGDFERSITTALGPRLKDPAKLHAAVEAASQARADVFALAITDDPHGIVVRAPVRDEAAADRAVSDLFELSKAEPFKDILHTRDVTAASEDLSDGKLKVLRLAREVPQVRRTQRPPDAGTSAGPMTTATVGVAWRVQDGRLALAAGSDALETWRAHATARPLAEEPALGRFLKAVGSSASTIAIAQPLRLDPGRARLPTAPLAVAVTRKGSDAVVLVDVADSLIREAARWQMGF